MRLQLVARDAKVWKQKTIDGAKARGKQGLNQADGPTPQKDRTDWGIRRGADPEREAEIMPKKGFPRSLDR